MMNRQGRTQGHKAQDWNRRMDEVGLDSLKGFRVEANDGDAGRVEQVLYWTDTREPDFIVISTGRWFLGRKAVLPVVDIIDVDVDTRQVRLAMSRDEVYNAPEFLPLS